MNANRDRLVLRAAALILLLGAASMALAQSTDKPTVPTVAGMPVELRETATRAAVPSWGTVSTSVLNVNAWDFDHVDPYAVPVMWTWGARYISSGGTGWLAGLSLPSGAIVLGIEAQACDNSSTAQLVVSLYRQVIVAGVETNTGIGGAALQTGIAAMPGCGTFSVALTPETISNDGQSYLIGLNHGTALDGSVRFQSIRVLYKLQVSPAPAVATFTDVPTDYWAFQYIEALKASGITQGVTPTTFEPESNVTRAQMAVFLAKALGLHWPN